MNNLTDSQILDRWYEFAAEQPDSVDSLLRILREKQGQTIEEQRHEFNADLRDFNHIRSMRLPRPNSFSGDAHRMALACHLGNPIAFVRALVLAHNLSLANDGSSMEAYKAALDPIEDIDEPPSEE